MSATDHNLALFIGAPDNQIDTAMSEKLVALIKKSPQEQIDGICDVLDECAFGSRCTDFSIRVLDVVLGRACEDAGTTKDHALYARRAVRGKAEWE